jgi:hypothetical protein
MLRAVRRLSATMPESDRLDKGGYQTHKDHWIGWLSEYDGPGYYGRSDWNVDARTVYQRLNNGRMIVWLNEAAGERPALVRTAIREMKLRGNGRKTNRSQNRPRSTTRGNALHRCFSSDSMPACRGSGRLQCCADSLPRRGRWFLS